MADEPKAPRKRAAKKAVSEEKKSTKKSPVIPVPLFQAAPVSKTPKVAKPVKAAPAVAAVESKGSDSESEEFRRRRRRGGRGRRRNGKEGAEGLDNESADLASDSESLEVTHKRRRRRRAKGEGVVPGETVEEDGVITVVKVREARVRPPRSEAKTFNRRDRNKFDRPDRRERRDFTRRRGTVITESEFLARREAVERSMLVRQIADRTQIAIIEDDVMVEHYVNRNSNISYVGNVYLGKVQNVLPSMEAAFVDIGKGRNAVLYAGEVNWDAHGLSDAAPRKIEHVLKSGQSVLVQVTKDPIGQKGARLTSQISLPGRFLVYVPNNPMTGISRKLPDRERSRLKTILKAVVPEDAGVIVRTASEGASEEELGRDVARLAAQWTDIEAKSKTASPPTMLYGEPDISIKVVRDIFNEDVKKLIVSGADAWETVEQYVSYVAPDLADRLEKHVGTTDVFTEYRIDEQIAKALDRKVYLPSGGSLVIDRTEAMTVVDVNTGKFIGQGGNLEQTVTKNNMEAAEEIVRQLRLRDIGGIIVIDFIDMVLESNRDQVIRRLIECLGRDRTKHQVAEVTSLGLVQMTRKRIGAGLLEVFSEPCDHCQGRGAVVNMDGHDASKTPKNKGKKGNHDHSHDNSVDSTPDSTPEEPVSV